MTIWTVFLVGIGGFFGSISRYGISEFAKKRSSQKWPMATLIINLSGSFLLGVFFGLDLNQTPLLLIGTGFLGGYTTFSTLNLEAVRLKEAKQSKAGKLYLLASYAGGVFLAALGLTIGLWLARD
ncbi:CrcB protein [Alkalihalobacillus xiaoxiensis]|uniref:Fluoride-specific ion channel FluC n=1 Tax=Shouchella xiaoxiensis TaxID=766895 RepID=A0ABS2SUK4_9BACI|nr:fluoride efflux transporter CrcB [Shouchella xiaoxiensis]MBM7839159.1 CrcB protein [Shouchella xiaoxiensis]